MSFKMKLNRSCHLLFILNFLSVCMPSESVLVRKLRRESVVDLPNNLIIGAGTSDFQIEGAWNTSGKSESYHKYKEDAKVLNDIGLNMYRFPMSWPRLLPTGGVDNVSKEAVAYYHAVLDELEKIGVEPMVTLHYYDHPVILEQSGGWLNETTIQLYVEYARFVFQEFGHRVKHFITFNEANTFCHYIYSTELGNSQKNESEITTKAYTCAHNLLKAHAEVYHMYHKNFDTEKDGKISISIWCENYEAKHKRDRSLAKVAFEFGCGWIAHPIFSKLGDYPLLMKLKVRANSEPGQSKLPKLTRAWIKKIRGSADFFAVSYYSSHLVEPAFKSNSKNPHLPSDAGVLLSADSSWTQASNRFPVVPSGLRSVLRKIKKKYCNPPVYITENGYANDGRLDDEDRINFLRFHLRETLAAIKYDKCNVRAYFYWSLIDSFNFKDGFTAHVGLAHVDFNDPNRPRTLKKSATWLRKVIKTRKLSPTL